jgi:hypothetical protein
MPESIAADQSSTCESESIPNVPKEPSRPRRKIKLPVRYRDGAAIDLVDSPSTAVIVNALATEDLVERKQELGFDPDEPTVEQAATTDDWPEWSVAIHEELASLMATGTFIS